MKKILVICSLFLAIGSAVPVYAALDYGGLVKCDGVVDPNEPARNNECDFQDLIGTVNSIIKWIFMLSIPVFIGLFAYAGFLYMTPSPGNREKSNKMLWAALKGFVIMLVAWFMVSTLLSWIVSDSFKGTASSLLE
ncbi:MAG: hypothetical protein AAB610_02500 [Patescibacteria group bacterium]